MCIICERLNLWKSKKNPYFIHEFKNSIFVVGDHQFFDGYSLLLFKEHVSDITDLPLETQTEFFGEVMTAGKAIKETYHPHRLNYSCLGNVVEHVHFHIFPRYEKELLDTMKKNPWFNSELFDKKKQSEKISKAIAAKLRNALQ